MSINLNISLGLKIQMNFNKFQFSINFEISVNFEIWRILVNLKTSKFQEILIFNKFWNFEVPINCRTSINFNYEYILKFQ